MTQDSIPTDPPTETRMIWFGWLRLTEDAVVLDGLFNRKRIPYRNITGVDQKKLMSRIVIETASGQETVDLWTNKHVPVMADEIERRAGEAARKEG